jgi:NADH-quinone oxidoreductase subunit N
MRTDILSPDLAYGSVLPLLIVFGGALVGVLVEAFLPARSRRMTQIVVTVLSLLGALAAVVWLAGTRELVFAEAIAVDGMTLFLQGLLAVLGIVAVLLLSERSLDASGGPSSRRRPCCPAAARTSRWPRPPRCRPRSTRSRCSAWAG